ncbi:hypothetical protein LDENG_00091580 [Lucifuga dentata]|nr:hypothetical protein LDENG_00091580 [Lucifuga dentata]
MTEVTRLTIKLSLQSDVQRNEDFPASLDKLQELIEDKLHVLQTSFTEDQQVLACEEDAEGGGRGLWRFAVLSEELTFDLRELQQQTEQELSSILTRRRAIGGRRRQLDAELVDLQEKKKQTEERLNRKSSIHVSTLLLSDCQELQAAVSERLVQSETLLFQEEALGALHNLLSQNLHRYQEEMQKLSCFTQKILGQKNRLEEEEAASDGQKQQSMQGKNEHNNMQSENAAAAVTSQLASSSQSPLSLQQRSKEEAEQAWRTNQKKAGGGGLSRSSNLQRAGSVKVLITKFSGSDHVSPQSPASSNGFRVSTLQKSVSDQSLFSESIKPSSTSPIPSVTVTPPSSEIKNSPVTTRMDCPAEGATEDGSAKTSDSSNRSSEAQSPKTRLSAESGGDSMADSVMGSESELETNKQPDSPASEEEPSTPRVLPIRQNPKYQLFLNNDLGVDGPAGENGSRLAQWESSRPGFNHFRGSLESLASRDWDTMSDRVGFVDSAPRVFNSPVQDLNLYSFNGRSTSPVPGPIPAIAPPRSRLSTYEALTRRRAEVTSTVVPAHHTLRSSTLGASNKRDYIEELTKQMDACQKRNQFLEAESVEMEKERNQIRFEMRALLVNKEDLLRTNAQQANELKRTREQMIEMDRENQTMRERFRDMEIEIKEAREMMVEANTQEYAFNFLQQTLKNRIQDTEENLEKQTQHAQTLEEKLWLAERQLEELQVDKDSRDKKTAELNSNIIQMETELGEALQVSTQAAVELNLQQKLREDAQMRLEELEESMLEKDQELQRLQGLVSRLQEEACGKLSDTAQTLEEEIQLRERMQLQVKQAERTVEDLNMELQTCNQSRDELSKQLKQAQEKMIDLEADLEELHDSEQRWASKHKRAIEQTEQLQLKLIQEKDLNEQLESEKAVLERQLRELRLEVEELQSSRVQEDVISRTEGRVKELESALRAEERSKVVLTNTLSKLERKISEMSDQMEEEHRIATEQKDLMAQRIRSLKRQLNEAEEDASRKEAQYRHTQRELAEQREAAGRLQRQLLEQHLLTKYDKKNTPREKTTQKH